MFFVVANLWFPSFRHGDKDAEFVTLCKSLHVTDPVCDRAWTLWKTVQESVDEAAVRICTYCSSVVPLYIYKTAILSPVLEKA